MCEEYETFHDRTGRPVVEGQSSSSSVPSVIKTDVLLNDDDHAHRGLQLQRYEERFEKLSQQDRLSKFCMDAGFQNVVEIGQYFMTRDTEEFSQFTDSVPCREYILPIEEGASEPKGWIRGNTKIGPVLEVATCCQQGKYGVENLNWVYEQGPFSLVGQNFSWFKQVGHEFERPWARNLRSAVRRKCVKIECGWFCKSSSTKTFPIGERTWTDIEPQDYSLTDYSVSKKLINLLRHGSLSGEDDGAIEFWRIKDYLQNHFVHSRHWSDEKLKSIMARGGGNKKKYQSCTDSSGAILYLRALQGHSGRSLIDPELRDNVINSEQFLPVHLSSRMC